MTGVIDYAPIAAAGFAVPQFLPQLRKLAVTRDAAGVSWSWAVLTSLNNAAWAVYFTLARYWTALIPASSATLLAGTLAVMLTRRAQARPRSAILISTWAAMLITACGITGRAGLGTLLTAAFILQVTPSIWAAYRTARPTGISAGTWLLILGELSCWLAFGLGKSDARLITLGVSGVAASALMLTRIRWTRITERPAAPRPDSAQPSHVRGRCGAEPRGRPRPLPGGRRGAVPPVGPGPADLAAPWPTVRDVDIDFGTTVDIDRPAQDVWALLADYGRDPQWRAGVLSMRADPPGRAAPGTTTAEVMRFAGRTLRNDAEIVRVGPGHELAWRTTSGVDAHGVRAVEPRGPERCRVRLATRVRPHGPGRVLAPLAHLLLQRRITGDGRRLRALAEGAG
jgi:uncharacterized protein YndB with AHSA1/START domain/uncharacterized protein with PQ loop repeat